ncbi:MULTISPECIES: hypothetical protein [Streptomyces]|uniref:Uncharacterized protein n=1 Tax=Streptomyces flaveolus TaxID=67297 RepID=A0ABV3AQ26_9ACTN|nr:MULTISPECIES: hypothetical protein [Streptomyces]KMS84170.1 hypothetical protein ACZ91_49275 [Streptomyces regensis]KOG74494.1 hypothetical protein ADK77_05150 [Streptomyces antibioticus]
MHVLVEAGTEATGSHVGMSRGPRDVTALSALVAAGSPDPGHWKTGDYYCCVVPSQDFTRRFDRAPDELPQVVRAIAARMRWNGWHFMPHACRARGTRRGHQDRRLPRRSALRIRGPHRPGDRGPASAAT